MKTNLLFTTAIAALFSVNGAMAETIENQNTDHGYYHNNDDLSIESGSIFRNNTTEVEGGVIANYGSSLTIGDNVQFIGNKAFLDKIEAPAQTDPWDAELGGAVYSEGNTSRKNTVTIGNNVLFDGNQAREGGAMFVFGNNDITVGNNATFSNNETLAGKKARMGGGAISMVSNYDENGIAKLTIGDNSRFIGNKAWFGGAVDVNSKDSVLVIGDFALFEGNEADGFVGGAIYNTGTVTIGTNATFSGNTATYGRAIYNTGTLNMKSAAFSDNGTDIYNTGTINVNGDLSLDGGVAGNGTINFADGSILTVRAGTTSISNTVNNEGATTLHLTFDNGFDNGAYTLISGDLTGEDFTGFDNNALYNITTDDGGKSFQISKKSSSEIAASTGATGTQAAVLATVTAGASSNASFNKIAENINTLLQSANPSDVQSALNAVTALAPETAPLVQTATTETVNQVFGAVGSRLSGGTVSAAAEGKSSGDDAFERAAVWGQVLFNKSKLDTTADGNGFEADTNGLAFGFEKQINDDFKAGFGYAFGKTDVDGFMRSTDIDTHTVMAYGEYKPSNLFVNGIASYSRSKYKESKNVAGIGVNAKYDTDTFALQAVSGYDASLNGLNLIPQAGLRYIHTEQDAYTDTAGQHVSTGNTDTLTGIAGVKVAKSWKTDDSIILTPELKAAATYDLKNTETTAVVALANGSSYTAKGKALDRFGMELGVGLTAEIGDSFEFSAGYEGKFRDHYQDHTGLINAKYKF